VEQNALDPRAVPAPVDRLEKHADLLGRRALGEGEGARANVLGCFGRELEGERARIRLPVVMKVVLGRRRKLEILSGREEPEEKKGAPHCWKQ
jgi:hypothetical protein